MYDYVCDFSCTQLILSIAVAVTYMLFFFFSSRRRHTRFDCDWSSDVCSSDLGIAQHRLQQGDERHVLEHVAGVARMACVRSEERRVGKECRSRWSPYH